MDELNEELILVPWKNLFRKYKGVSYYSGENHRSFRAWTGCSPFVCEKIFRKYQHPDYLPDRSRLIIALNYMKTMPTEDEGATSFKITRKTYRKYVWGVLFYLEYIMDEINIDDRYLNSFRSYCSYSHTIDFWILLLVLAFFKTLRSLWMELIALFIVLVLETNETFILMVEIRKTYRVGT
jgi:hypothetical protein